MLVLLGHTTLPFPVWVKTYSRRGKKEKFPRRKPLYLILGRDRLASPPDDDDDDDGDGDEAQPLL